MNATAGCSAHRSTTSKKIRSLFRRFPVFVGAPRRFRLGSTDDGQSLVEFALVVPLLLLVLTGIFSFGIIFNQYMVLTNAANSAARAFAASAGAGLNAQSIAANNDPCAYAAAAVQSDVPGLDTNNLTYKIIYTVLSTNTATTYNGTASTNPTCSSVLMNVGDSVQVTVTYPVSALLYSWTSKSYTLTAQSTEFVQ
jgi:Flp pilus assembly protein TadG